MFVRGIREHEHCPPRLRVRQGHTVSDEVLHGIPGPDQLRSLFSGRDRPVRCALACRPPYDLKNITAAVATVDKEGVTMVSTFKRLEYPSWNGVHIHTDHRNLAYIFDLEACVSWFAKMTAQRLDQWKALFGQYDYTLMHIAGDRNCWKDLLSRWVTVTSVSVGASAVYADSEPDKSLPSKQAIQQASRVNLGTLATGARRL